MRACEVSVFMSVHRRDSVYAEQQIRGAANIRSPIRMSSEAGSPTNVPRAVLGTDSSV